MIKLKEVICYPSPPTPPLHVSVSSPVPFTVSIQYAVLLFLTFISLCRCSCPLFISVTVAMSDAFSDAIIVVIALSSSTPVLIAVYLPSLYVACFLLTFPSLYLLGSLRCDKLESYPCSWWWHACRALCTSWYCWRHQPWSIPQPPGESGEQCSAFAGHSFHILVLQSCVQDAGRGLSWWGDLLFFGTYESPLLPPFLGASGEAFSWQSPFARPIMQPLWLNKSVEVLPQ